MTENISTAKVFDIPTRLFHWVFAILFVFAFSVAKFTDDDGALYPYHMLVGMIMVLAICLRLIWGVIGSKYARFNSFDLNPISLIEYLKSILNGQKKPKIGRNPASSFAAIAMFGLSISLGISGYLMASATNENQKHNIEEFHEVFAHLFLIIALLHILGIIIHTISQKDPIARAMIDGKKTNKNGEVGIANNHGLIGILFLAILSISASALAANYNKDTKTLFLGNQSLQLGENETAEEADKESDEGEKSEEKENEVGKPNENHKNGEKENDKDDDD